MRQLILGELAALGVEPQDAVGVHAAGPQLAVLGERDVVGREDVARLCRFLGAFGLGVDLADAFAAEFGERDAVVVVDWAAARARLLSGLGVERLFRMLG